MRSMLGPTVATLPETEAGSPEGPYDTEDVVKFITNSPWVKPWFTERPRHRPMRSEGVWSAQLSLHVVSDEVEVELLSSQVKVSALQAYWGVGDGGTLQLASQFSWVSPSPGCPKAHWPEAWSHT